jgi:hypothetical protein
MYKLVLTRLRGEPRVAITHRDFENWEGILTCFKKKLHRKTHITLSCHAVISVYTRQKLKYFRVDSKHSNAYFKIQRSNPAGLRG